MPVVDPPPPTVSMRDYVDLRFNELAASGAYNYAAWIRAYERDERDLERRLAAMNEFRDQLTDQARTFMTRIEFDNRHADLQAQMERSFDERDRRTQLALTTTQEALVKAEIANEKRFERLGDVVGSLSALDARVNANSQRLDLTQGRSTGLASGWVYLIGGMGLVSGVVGILLGLKGL